MNRPALKIVEGTPFYMEEGELWPVIGRSHHSLHYTSSYRDSFSPDLPSYFIKKYSKVKDVVLDPFCGRGTTSLEANLLGRVAYFSDLNPLALKISRAKLEPVDITEVTLFLQRVNFNLPVNLDQYAQIFKPFYDYDTYREIINLKRELAKNPGRVANFVEMIALGVLHGHSAGFLSAYTFPQISVSPQQQNEINDKRRQNPEYRSVSPRILRKAALALRDGDVSVLEHMYSKNKLKIADARNLSFIESASVDLVVTAPPRPCAQSELSDFWLQNWFANINTQTFANDLFLDADLSVWLDFMNEFLFEMARVVKPGARVVLDLREMLIAGKLVQLDSEVLGLVEQSLARFWSGECALVHKPRNVKLQNSLKERDLSKSLQNSRILVLRRK